MLPLGRSFVHRLGLMPFRYAGIFSIGKPLVGLHRTSGVVSHFSKRITTSPITLNINSETEKQEKQGEQEQGSEAKAKAHKERDRKKKSKEKKQRENTPLDDFFLSFPTYKHDPSLPPATSLKKLKKHFGWDQKGATTTKSGDPKNSEEAKKKADFKEALSGYYKALKAEVKVWYGNENDITACHTLCRAVGIANPPGSVKKCISLLHKTHVNIVDLVDWGRNGSDGDKPVRVFPSIEKLIEYTVNKEKYYPQNEVENDGERNVVLRHLLRRIFKRSRKSLG